MNDNLSIDQKLAQCLGPEWISSRSGFGGTKVMYLEGKTAINLANEIFGYNGWSSEIKNSVVDFMDTTDDGRVNLGIATTVRVTLKDGTYHEDTGYGLAENAKGKAAAFEKARKESATDALKRAIRMFGNATGNCIYDKTYLRNIANMGRPSAPFIPFDLYRQEHIRKVIRAEMESSTGPAISPATRPSVQVKQEQQQQQQQKTPPAPVMNPVPAPVVKPTPVASTTTHTSIPTPIKNEPEKNTPDETTTPTKRALEDDVFAEDSFMIDDEDVAFYAEIIETEVDDKVDIELLEQVMQNNRDPPSDPSTKRQRQ